MDATTTTQRAPSAGTAERHPELTELVGGIDLRARVLREHEAAPQLELLAEMMGNADYWLSFDLAKFEPSLAVTPSPLRELGVAIALRYGERIDGLLCQPDLDRFREALGDALPEPHASGIERGLQTLERMVAARDRELPLGFTVYKKTLALSVHALRASGRSVIEVEGETGGEVPLGASIRFAAKDERGRPLDRPEIETRLDAPLWVRNGDEPGTRTAIFRIPGTYRVRVPGKLEGDRKLLAR